MNDRDFDYDPELDDHEVIQDLWLDESDDVKFGDEVGYSVAVSTENDEDFYDDVDHDKVIALYGYQPHDSHIGEEPDLDTEYHERVSMDSNSDTEDELSSSYLAIRCNLVDSIEQSLGIRVVANVARFYLAGWYLQGEGPVPCAKCGENFRVFRCPYETSVGIYKYWAVVCQKCRLVLTFDEITGAEKKVLIKWGQENVKELSNRTKKIRKLERAAAEHIVMFELNRRGIMVTQPPIGVTNVDLCLVDDGLNIVKSLQVKTFKILFNDGWLMHFNAENLVSPRHFSIFVNIEREVPICYVIPSEVISQATKHSRNIWIKASSTDSNMSKELDIQNSGQSTASFETHSLTDGWIEKYRGRWGLLID